ncbi:MAG: zinc-ribbon domain-containing protein [Clostridia bacterium]|nr:zinc-ribbon domain-containing protein [Clostridia bacterium]
MFCKNCGQESTDNSRFCHFCGTELAPESTPAEEPTAQKAETPIQPEVNPVNYSAPITPADPGAGLGTAAFILGIVGLSVGAICSCLFATLGGILPLACAIVAVVLGINAKKKSAAVGLENKKAKIGLILGVIAIAVIVVFIALNGILGAIMGSWLATTSYDLYY